MFVILTGFTCLWSSGTFFYQAPPKLNRNIDLDTVLRGQSLFTKTVSNGKSCASCHAKKAQFKFRRRKLSQIINNLHDEIEKCSTSVDRMALNSSVVSNEIEIKSIQLFIADQWKILDYLK